MNCPSCHSPMTLDGRFWNCGDCEARLPATITAGRTPQPSYPGLDRLPSLLAIPLAEYGAERHRVMRLHRLCDAVEILTRFCAVALLGELTQRLGDSPLPEELLKAIQPNVATPTFGRWCGMLSALESECRAQGGLVVPELPDFIRDDLLTLVPNEDQPGSSVLVLRNLLVHGGGMTTASAEVFLATSEPRLRTLIDRAAFLGAVEVCRLSDGKARQLLGAEVGEGPERPLSAALAFAVRDLDGHVVLLNDERWIDLWPLCDYGRARLTSLEGTKQAKAASPLLYNRAENKRLLYAALGVDLPQSERADVVARFRNLFQLDNRAPEPTGRLSDFEAELKADADAFLGRIGDLKTLKDAVKAAKSGVLWVSGPGGIGKSYLVAKLAANLGNATGTWRIFWRFKASDAARCNRVAFLRHAVERLAGFLGRTDVVSSQDPKELDEQFRTMLDASAGFVVSKLDRLPRVLFVLDGLDEVAHSDPDFPTFPLRFSNKPGVIWLCAGRPEGELPATYTIDRCTHVFPDGLPAMTRNDIRALLLDRTTGEPKYDLLRRDVERPSGTATKVENTVIDAIADRAKGLPLFVHFVVEDILSGHFRIADLEHFLPDGLVAYFDDLLKRLSIGAVQALLTPLITTIAWAHEPLDEDTLHLLMARWFGLDEGEADRTELQRALLLLGPMIRLGPLPQGGLGYVPYHDTFRQHIREDASGLIGSQNKIARKQLAALVSDWESIPKDHSARGYVLRHGPRTLMEDERWQALEKLLLDLERGIFFLEAKVEIGLVFDLVHDFGEAVRLRANDPSSRIIRLLGQSLQFNAHFLAHHPTTVFQCLWNHGWWYDCPGSVLHDQHPPGGWSSGDARWDPADPRLFRLMEHWRQAKERRTPGFFWVRSLRPPQVPLGSSLLAVFRGRSGFVQSVAFSPDGRRIVSGSNDCTVRIWDAETGAQIARLDGHEGMANSVAFSPDGRRIVSGSNDCTVRIWDAETGAQIARLDGHQRLVILHAAMSETSWNC